MKKILGILVLMLLPVVESICQSIIISTERTDLILKVGTNGRLYQAYLGEKLLTYDDIAVFDFDLEGRNEKAVSEYGWEVYPGSGAEDYCEPAVAITHADGNLCTILEYAGHSRENTPYGSSTEITLRDRLYPVEVTLKYEAYSQENIIKVGAEIQNKGRKPIELWRYASTILYFNRESYYLTEFASDWAKESQMKTQRLQFGKKIIDTKLGSRSAMHVHPFFEVGMNAPAEENKGEVLLGTLGWTGNFSFTFEVDNKENLRIIPAINPYASDYKLNAGESFVTPDFVFTLSKDGVGQASRDFHDWARKYQLKAGIGDRMCLLNNWENTRCNFDQELLAGLMEEADNLGVDLFLLDDGWFANKYPRNDSRAGLGDWEANSTKLPGGIRALTDAATKAGVRFGIWIEPEMVNPKSELFEKHPDWAYTLPDREPYYYRNQLVLDLNNPEVQDYVFGVVDKLLTENPGIAYFKWDCNSPITNVYSHYLKEDQQQLYIGHVRGLYNILDRIQAKYPDLPMMLCSGGGSRCDYKALEYFTEFWCSDNTDPIERLYIQWGFSQFFPAKAMCAHVTNWNDDVSIKFRTDVASMCKLGFDIGLKILTEDEMRFMQDAVKNWNKLKPVIMDGDQYRLVSPYEGNHTATMYASKDSSHAVLFAFDIRPRFREKVHNVKLRGLSPEKTYKVAEINRMDAVSSWLRSEDAVKAGEDRPIWDGKTFSGDYLMKVGLPVFTSEQTHSTVVEIIAL